MTEKDMEKFHTAWLRIKGLFQRRQLERDLHDEMAFHLAMREEQNRRAGMDAIDARSAARRQFGNATRVHEQSRRMWTFPALESWWTDLRYAGRMLRNAPVMSFVVVLSLALGIGANTAIFSVMNTAMLKPLPVPDPERLQLLTWTSQKFYGRMMEDLEGTTRDDSGKMWSYSFPSFAFEYMREHSHSFDGLVAFSANSDEANIGVNGRAESTTVQAVSGDFFSGLRIVPEHGRLLTREDDRPGATAVAMLSYRFWRSHFGSDPGFTNASIAINGQPVSVIGVLPATFSGLDPGSPPDVWVPLEQHVEALKRSDNYDVIAPKVWWLAVMGRLKHGVTTEQARTEMRVVLDQTLTSAHPDLPHDEKFPVLDMTSLARGMDNLRRQVSSSLILLMGMVGLVLLIACANVAALLLARATARRREIAVRLSLGASRARVVRQMLTESVLLGALGGLAGCAVAQVATSALMSILRSGRDAVDLVVKIDGRVLLFTATVSLLCGVLFGLAPALRVLGVDLFPVLKLGVSPEARGGHKFIPGKLLVGGQVALCLLLLVGAGLLGRTLLHVQRVQLGFDPYHLVSFRVQPGMNGYKDARLMTYYSELKQRLESIPGVRSVGMSQLGPIDSGSSRMDVHLPGYTQADQQVPLYRHVIGPGYFETLSVPVVMGRAVNEGDTATSPMVATVNQRAVVKYFHGDDPVGRLIEFGSGKDAVKLTIVGVVGDVRYNKLRDAVPPTAYFSYRQRPEAAGMMTFLVRTAGEEPAFAASIKAAAAAVDKDVPVMQLTTETEVLNGAMRMERLLALLSSVFGGLALLLACIGLYGTIGYTVVRRTNEIGIRMALGAGRARILTMVLRETVVVVAAGLLVGLPLAWFSARVLGSQLFGLSPHDPLTIALAVVAIVCVTILSGLLPARRAARVDPMVALRCE
jgi:predicted permease